MDRNTILEFKLILAGGALMITGTGFFQAAGVEAAIGYFLILFGIVMLLGGLTGYDT